MSTRAVHRAGGAGGNPGEAVEVTDPLTEKEAGRQSKAFINKDYKTASCQED